mgnify:CR=1 FL=1
MKILFTGSSSFTGYHFLKEINKNKIKTYAVFSKKINNYKDAYQKEILDSKLKYVKPISNLKFGSKKYIKIIKEKKIDTICFHHFIVGNLNDRYNFNKNLKILLKNIEEVIQTLSNNKKPTIIYTSSVYQRISTKYEYINDKSRINYGFAKLILNQVLSFMCKKKKIQFINFELQNPIGKFEKKNSLPYYVSNCFLNDKEIKLKNPNRIFTYQFIDFISKDYAKVLKYKKNIKSKYKKNTIYQFKNLFIKKLERYKKKNNLDNFWSEYLKYYISLDGIYKN